MPGIEGEPTVNADRVKGDVQQFRAHAGPGAPAGATAPTERLAAVGKAAGRKTRRTVDLTAAQHRALDIWQREAADRIGVARITGQQVLTALIDELLTDRQLAARVTRSIQARR
jgi:hypothetical protein